MAKQATIWNPNTAEKKVINVGDAMPTGFSLWTGGTATGQQAQAAIKQSAQTSNKIDSDTFKAGVETSTLNLPSSNDAAIGLYTDRSLQDATTQQKSLQSELDAMKAQRIKDNEAALKAEQENLKTIQNQQDSQINSYDAQFNPLKDKAIGIYDSMLNSIKDTDYSALTKQKLDLTNDIVNYSKLMREELDTAAAQPGLASISNARQNAIKENYTSKIAIAQAAQSAIDGNFNLAFDIMDKGATAIERLTNDRINFINSVKAIFSSKENLAISNVNRLTTEESKLLDEAVKDAETKLANIQKNKETIMEIMNTNPIIANKAGLSLTDTPEQITEKLNKFYVANPQYTPDNQEMIKKIMEKYFDAGITMSDHLDTVMSKLKNSRLYQQDTASNYQLTTSPDGKPVIFNPETGAYSDASSYKLGSQVGTVSGLPAYDTRTANPGVTRSNRNNNPGNIKVSNYSKNFDGVVGVESSPAADGGNFLIFDSPEAGLAAMGRLLQEGKSYQGVTAEVAMKRYNGGGAYGAATVGLDPNKDFQSQIADPAKLADVVKRMAAAEGFKPTTASSPTGFSDTAMAYAKDILAGRIKLENIPGEKMKNEVTLAKAELEKTEKPLADKLLAEGLDDKIAGLNSAINSQGMKGTVGAYGLARWTPFTPDKSERQNFIATVEQLISQETIDKLIQSKAAGATYGALSDGEREMLSKAASKIGTWRIPDKNGKVIGYEISESLMKKELETIRDLAQKAKDRILGDSVITPPDQLSDDEAWNLYQSIKQ